MSLGYLYQILPKGIFVIFVLYTLTAIGQFSGVVPATSVLVDTLSSWYQTAPLVILAVGALITTLAYINLYIPSALIILVAIINTNGTVYEFLEIGMIVTAGIIPASIINYFWGTRRQQSAPERTLPWLVGHSNLYSLSLWYFDRGAQGKTLIDALLLTTLVMPWYSVVICYLIYPIGQSLGSTSWTGIALLFCWVCIGALYKHRKAQHEAR